MRRDIAGKKGGKRTWQQSAKVLITYRSNLADDSLKKAGGNPEYNSKGEAGDNRLFKRPSDSHLCIAKCLPPIAGLCATPDCTAYHVLALQLSHSSVSVSLSVPHCWLLLYPSHLIYSMSFHLSLCLPVLLSPRSMRFSRASICVLYRSFSLFHLCYYPVFCFCLFSLCFVLLLISLPPRSAKTHAFQKWLSAIGRTSTLMFDAGISCVDSRPPAPKLKLDFWGIISSSLHRP